MYDQLITIILIAVILGADAFSLSLGMGLKGVSRTYELRFAGVVGIFHVVMPLAGLNLGLIAGKFLGIWAARLGALVLVYIGVNMLIEGYGDIRPKSYSFSEAKNSFNDNSISVNEGWTNILVLTVSVSIDALTVGFSLGTVKMPVLITVIIMGIVAGVMTLLGFKSGKVFGKLVGSYAQIIGGLILVALAIKMIF